MKISKNDNQKIKKENFKIQQIKKGNFKKSKNENFKTWKKMNSEISKN